MDSRAALSPSPALTGLPSSSSAEENLLVHGDNLAVLRGLRGRFEGKVRLAYLDPPYNSGRAFAEYDDRWEPGHWASFMEERLRALHPLLADDGAVAVQIDDNELATLRVVMDEVFGRANRVSLITVVRSAATGHKAQNRGPVHVTDFVLLYARNRTRFRPAALTRPRRGYDEAYGTFVPNLEEGPRAWRFVPLAAHVAKSLTFSGPHAAKKARESLGADAFASRVATFALAHAEAVVRFAQPRFEAVSREAQGLIETSRANPDDVFTLERTPRPPLHLRGGNRILFLASKVREDGGRRVLVEPLTNLWDDVPFQGIAREGGVAFVRNKKPERLLQRLVALCTEAGDWVLDPFLGSGTTAAVAHKMGRRWVGVEAGEHFHTLCLPRLRRVVDGTDPSGITRAEKWQGGGGFAVVD